MKLNVKDWKTTLLGIFAGLMVILGILLPEKFDLETQATVNTALSQVVTGIGALVAIIAGLIAKDK